MEGSGLDQANQEILQAQMMWWASKGSPEEEAKYQNSARQARERADLAVLGNAVVANRSTQIEGRAFHRINHWWY